jgi:hypothetical protein
VDKKLPAEINQNEIKKAELMLSDFLKMVMQGLGGAGNFSLVYFGGNGLSHTKAAKDEKSPVTKSR